MSPRRKLRRVLIHVLMISIIFACFFTFYYMKRMIPQTLRVVQGQESDVRLPLPITATLRSGDGKVALAAKKASGSDGVSMSNEVPAPGDASQEAAGVRTSDIPADQIHVMLDEGFSLYSEEVGEYTVELELFGLFSFREIQVEVVEEEMVVPCGCPIGIYLDMDGILIVGTGQVTDLQGNTSEPAYGLVRSGDYILQVDAQTVETKEELVAAICDCDGDSVVLTVRRGGQEIRVEVPVVQTAADEYKAGIWVRDDTQGIGTLSYVDMKGRFGALGHGISDSDTGQVIEDEGGLLYDATIRSVIKGTINGPGSLAGVINYGGSHQLGEIYDNTECGIYGQLSEEAQQRFASWECMPIGYRQEVEMGPAQIRCCVDGEVEDYDIQIIRADMSSTGNKGLVIQVTDERLLMLTGGIVQG
ncbi:MAG: SpoIVB peptidase, partial [Lachnospiraceae bacterium]|nr:SpoIVB peptidase [Lachnospiraceae bacterium]